MRKLKIPFAKVPIVGNEFKYIREVLDSGWLTTASKALSFEEKFSKYVNAKYACAVNSCTAALHLGVDALGVRAGDKVFVPSMTFTASAEVIRYVGAHPVFLDVEYGSNLITPSILKKAIEKYPEVKSLIIVHYGGQAANMVGRKNNGEGIADICKRNNIKIIEDAAHAFPAKDGDSMIGSIGDITCFSFYANKTITTGEGGMLTTNDEDIYKRVKKMRLHGINKDIWDRFTSKKPSWEYDVVEAGFKYNMPDITAAIGLAQLEKAEEFRKERQKAVEYYFDHLNDLEMIDLPLIHVPFEHHAWHIFNVVLNNRSKISRNRFIEELSKHG
ncbi:MAG TPA: DegT/DnrJ/EryC1/StrS family aminotransferase, partial [Clostridia bacterium]|nr:DegT/DnrJ/EryC1/StrS family aminotransferase [Clostridia bacterium]